MICPCVSVFTVVKVSYDDTCLRTFQSDLSSHTLSLRSSLVTAGVLRGDKSRFQLFGDTMNTAARIETNGAPNAIHVSVETAALLMVAGKQNWLRERETTVEAKGKGELKT